MKKLLQTLALIVSGTVVFGTAVVYPMLHAGAAQNGGGHIPVTLCHRTGSVDGGNQHNGYDLITVDLSSISGIHQLNGHDGHDQVGDGPGPDLIPPATYTVLNGPDKGTVVNYPGKGLDWVFDNGQTGQQVLEAGCQFSNESPPPTSPPPTSPPPTSPPPTSPPPSVTPPVINPAADITVGTCAHRQFQVFLDNSASTDGSEEGGTAQFLITVNGEQFADVFNVAAGDTTEVDVPVVNGDIVNVYNASGPVDGHSLLASAQADLSNCNNSTPPPPNGGGNPPSGGGAPNPPSLPVTL